MFRRCERNTRGSRKEECPVHNGSAPPQLISLEKGMELCAPPLFLELCQVFCTALLQKIRLKASNDLKNGANTSNTRFQRTRVQDLIIVSFFDTDCKAFQSSSKKPESVIYSDAFPMPSQHTHHAFQDSLAFKGKLCRCHLAFQVSRTNSVALSGHQEHIFLIVWPATLRSATKRCCGRKALYVLKLSTMRMVEELLSLWLSSGTGCGPAQSWHGLQNLNRSEVSTQKYVENMSKEHPFK